MTESQKTIESLVADFYSPLEMVRVIDRAMLSMILLLKYEPEQLEPIIQCYESLYELKTLLIDHV